MNNRLKTGGASQLSKENFKKKDMFGNDLTVNPSFIRNSRKTARVGTVTQDMAAAASRNKSNSSQ